jgi:MFS family permease
VTISDAEPPRGGRLRRLGPDTRPLAIPEYRRLFLGQIVTVVGSQLTAVAVQQQVFTITGSSAWVGYASMVALVPLVGFGLLGGAIADTYDRRKLMMITSTGISVTSLGLWVQAILRMDSIAVVFVLLALQQGFFAANQPARSAILPRIVPSRLVPAANALNSTVFNTGVIAGPLLVGILLPFTGIVWLYFIDALSLTAILYAVFRLPPIPPLRTTKHRPKVSEGLAYLRTAPLLLMTFVIDIIAMVCGMPRALFPAMAEEIFGGPPEGGLALGLLNASMAIGALLGGLTGGWITRVRRQGVAIVIAVVVWGAAMAATGTTSLLWLAVVYLAIGGFADMVSSVYRNTILQVEATDEMRGRLQGVFTVVVAGGPRLADLVHGLVADATSIETAVVGGGLLCMALALVAGWIGRSMRRYDAMAPERRGGGE